MRPLIPIVLVALLTSCGGAKVYMSDDAKTVASTHKTIAIIPPSVSISGLKKTDPEVIKEQQKTESLNFQKEIYGWMLRRKSQGKIRPEILDIETTNAKLKRVNYPDSILSPAELCNLLGVEGVIMSNFAMSKPMSEGGAVALGILTGAWGPTNEVRVSMGIHDGNSKKLIWNYDHKYSGGVGSSPSRLVDELMRHASKRMPYHQ